MNQYPNSQKGNIADKWNTAYIKYLFFLIDGNLYDNDAKRMHGWEMIEEKYYKDIKHKFVKEE